MRKMILSCIFMLGCSITPVLYAEPGVDWTTIDVPEEFTPVMTLGIYDGKILCVGGYGNNFLFTTNGKEWIDSGYKPKPSSSTIPAHTILYYVFKENLYKYIDDAIYHLESDYSYSLVSPAFQCAWGGAICEYDGKLWVSGGTLNICDPDGNYTDWSHLKCSSDGTNWQEVLITSGKEACNVASHAMISFAEKLWILGGSGRENKVYYTTNGNDWKQASDMPWNSMYHLLTIVADNRLWVFSKDIDANVWTMSENEEWLQINCPKMYGRSAIVYDNKLWVFTGSRIFYTSLEPDKGKLEVTPTENLTASGQAGGAITPPSAVYTLSNVGTAALQYSVSSVEPWVEVRHPEDTAGVSMLVGELLASESTYVTVGFNTATTALTAGHYTADILFEDTTNNESETRTVDLTLTAPPSEGEGEGEASEGEGEGEPVEGEGEPAEGEGEGSEGEGEGEASEGEGSSSGGCFVKIL